MPNKSIPLAELKNIGKTTERWLNEVGVFTAEDLDRVGVVEAWKQVKEINPSASLVGLYALQGAVMDIHWNALPDELRSELKEAFEAK